MRPAVCRRLVQPGPCATSTACLSVVAALVAWSPADAQAPPLPWGWRSRVRRWAGSRYASPAAAGATATITELAPRRSRGGRHRDGRADRRARTSSAPRRGAATARRDASPRPVAATARSSSRPARCARRPARGRLTVALRPIHPRARRPATVQVDRPLAVWAPSPRASAPSEPGGMRPTVPDRATGSRRDPRRRSASVHRAPAAIRSPSQGPARFAARRVLVVRPASQTAARARRRRLDDPDHRRRPAAPARRAAARSPCAATRTSPPGSPSRSCSTGSRTRAAALARCIPTSPSCSSGANDGFPMGTSVAAAKAPCCDAAWVREYARRARTMMRSYARRGAGTVYWLLLPTPRSKASRPSSGRSTVRCGQPRVVPGLVHVVDLGTTFTPARPVPSDDALAGQLRHGAPGRRRSPLGRGRVDRHRR